MIIYDCWQLQLIPRILLPGPALVASQEFARLGLSYVLCIVLLCRELSRVRPGGEGERKGRGRAGSVGATECSAQGYRDSLPGLLLLGLGEVKVK